MSSENRWMSPKDLDREVPRFRVAVCLRIGRARLPRLVARLAGAGNGVEAPRFRARLGVQRRNEPADALVAAGRSDQHLVSDGQRHQREGLRHVLVSHLDAATGAIAAGAMVASLLSEPGRRTLYLDARRGRARVTLQAALAPDGAT